MDEGRMAAMALVSGSRLGPYEIVAALGAGGMGEVYRARDTRLDRSVAVKVLPELLAADPEFRERFDREARSISQLSHPHICALYDVGEAAVEFPASSHPSTSLGASQPPATSYEPPATSHEPPATIRFLVMELLEGETLASRLEKGAVPLDEALTTAIEIGSALDAAHRGGVVHRDLKPGNIILTKTGAKLLDFGLAKKGASAVTTRFQGSASMTAPPTMTTPPAGMTAQGTILGTFQYMAPEQLEGSEADPRTDIFAFGCVLYEMLTGKKAFSGRTQVSLISAILKDSPPPLSATDAKCPPALDFVVRRCIAKDPDRRWQTATDLVSQLEFIGEGGGVAAHEATAAIVAPAPRRSLGQRVLVAAVAVALAAATGVAAWMLKPAPARPGPMRFTVPATGEQSFAMGSPDRDIAISRDGTRIVYDVGASNATAQMMVRAIDQLDATQLRGLVSPRWPFLSPDGRWIGFMSSASGGVANGELRKVSITGGPSIALCRFTGVLYGASWAENDSIVFATTDVATGLLSVPAGGGEPKVLTKPDAAQNELDHAFPFVLPGGRAVLFTIVPRGNLASENSQVAVLDLKSGQRKTLIRGGGHAEYVATGHIVYAAAGSLRAVRFDPVKLEVLGDPVPVVEGVATKNNGTAEFGLSQSGTLVYVAGAVASDVTTGTRTLAWVDRHGREEPIKAPPRSYVYPRISPDGSKVALDVRDQDQDIWVWDVSHETLTRLTFDPTPDQYPVWSPDGKRILFSSSRASGTAQIFVQQADGAGTADQLTTGRDALAPNSLSPDGSHLVLRANSDVPDLQLLRLSASGTKDLRPETLVGTPFGEFNGEVSPDGHWLAYQSNESGRFEVYVRPFPNVNGGRWQISTGGGGRPLWAKSGKELFFLNLAGNTRSFMAVAMQTGGSAFSNGNPSKMFEADVFIAQPGRTFDVSRDGQRFLIVKEAVATGVRTGQPTNIRVVLNWLDELKKVGEK